MDSTATTEVTTDPLVQIEVAQQAKRLQLGKAETALDEVMILDTDITAIDAAETLVASLKKDIERLERRKVAEQHRREKLTVEEKAERLRQEQFIEQNIRQQNYDLVQEGDQHIATMKDWGLRMLAAANAGRRLGDRTLTYQCDKVLNNLRHFLGFALRGFPGMDSGMGPFIHLNDRSFRDVFPDPRTSTPTKKK